MIPSGPLTDWSGTTTANQSIVAAVAVNRRNYLIYQNVSDTDQWINFGGSASAGKGSVKFAAGTGETWEDFVPNQSFNVFCTGAKDFTLKEG